MESVWIKENAVFAYNRVLEIKERFQYYYKILEEQIAEKKEEERREEEKRKNLMVKETRKVVEAVDSLLTKVSGGQEGESDNVFHEMQEVVVGMGPMTPDSVELPDGDSKPVPVKTDSQGSLRYDAGIDEALRLLQSTAQSMLSQQATTPSSKRVTSCTKNVVSILGAHTSLFIAGGSAKLLPRFILVAILLSFELEPGSGATTVAFLSRHHQTSSFFVLKHSSSLLDLLHT